MMDFHPASNLFPLMSGEDFEALISDIAEHGQQEAIWLHPDGSILDGRNRWRACEALGIAPLTRTWDGEPGQEEAFVVSLNLYRRHLDKEQRAVVMRQLRAGGMTYQAIADAAGVSVGTVYNETKDVELFNIEKLPGADGKARPPVYAPRHEAEEQPKPLPAPANGKERTQQAMDATTYSHGSLDYYTPRELTDAARLVMGEIDLDPASCEAAQSWINALQFFTIDDDGMRQPWSGRVWLNPPYSYTEGKSNQDLWSGRLISEYRQGNVTEGLLLVKSALGYKWFERLWDDWPVCFLRERVSFVLPDGNDDGQSKQGTAIFYMGPNVDRFCEVFSAFGRVITPEAQYGNSVHRP